MVITRDRARSVLENAVSALCNSIAEKSVYLSPDIMNEPKIVLDDGKKVSSPYEAYFLGFVDQAPKANWTHDCAYVFINVQDGSCQIVKGTWPPDALDSLEKIS